MIGFVIVAVITWFVFKTARENGKNGLLWAVLTIVSFLGTQFLVGLACGLFMAFGIAFWGWDENVLTNYNFVVALIATILSFIPVYFIYRHVNRIPDDGFMSPPEPPKFNDR